MRVGAVQAAGLKLFLFEKLFHQRLLVRGRYVDEGDADILGISERLDVYDLDAKLVLRSGKVDLQAQDIASGIVFIG